MTGFDEHTRMWGDEIRRTPVKRPRYFCTICHAADPLTFIIGINRLNGHLIGVTFWLGKRRYLSVGKFLR